MLPVKVIRMRRREFVAGIASVALTARASARPRMPRIGVVLLGPAVPAQDVAIVAELARLGYITGRNVSYDIFGLGGDMNRIAKLGREVVSKRPDVVIGASDDVARGLAKATARIPIVMTVMGDPRESGLSQSASRPSRNVTGFLEPGPTLIDQHLRLLRELVPGLRNIAYLCVPWSDAQPYIREAAKALHLTVTAVPVTTESSVADGFAIADREAVQAVVVESNLHNMRLRGHIIDECLLRDLPAIHPWYADVHAGALLAYGPRGLEHLAGVARYVDRILKGAKVAELPIQEPAPFKLAINRRTAQAINMAIPPALLARADEVIQ
jgi:putative ABC transport system substrate-binding protein